MESLIKGSLLVHEAFLYMQWLGDILGGKKEIDFTSLMPLELAREEV